MCETNNVFETLDEYRKQVIVELSKEDLSSESFNKVKEMLGRMVNLLVIPKDQIKELKCK